MRKCGPPTSRAATHDPDRRILLRMVRRYAASRGDLQFRPDWPGVVRRRACRCDHLASLEPSPILHGAAFSASALSRLRARRRRVVVAGRLPARLVGAARDGGLRLPADARAPDGATISMALSAQRLAGLGGAALISHESST